MSRQDCNSVSRNGAHAMHCHFADCTAPVTVQVERLWSVKGKSLPITYSCADHVPGSRASTPTRFYRVTPLVECDSCAELSASVAERPNGETCCDACWRSALAHGHAHGLHDDGSADPTDPVLDDCPDCPPMHERVRRASLCKECGMPHSTEHECEPINWKY